MCSLKKTDKKDVLYAIKDKTGVIMDFVIFGAQSIALSTYQAFHHICPQKKIRCFLVSQIGKNPPILAGIPVLELSAFAAGLSPEQKDNTRVFIATPENVMGDIEILLENYRFHNYIRITSRRWAEFMGYYYTGISRFISLSALPVGCHKADIHMYMAKFFKDRPLTENYTIPNWVMPVQAGAILCKERVANLLDCDGENISKKNGNYSELTVLYWMWKNCLFNGKIGSKEGYYGLCHYRRVLELSKDDILRLEDNDVDVVLPFPMPYEPDIEEHHKRYLSDGDWNALLAALEELQPEYASVFPTILKQQYFYNYNIILARKDVLAEYCQWLFPILERVEQLSKPKGWERQDRYIGYMGETLETLYFMTNKDKLNIVHTGCRFLL